MKNISFQKFMDKVKFEYKYKIKRFVRNANIKIKDFFTDFTWKEFWFIFILVAIIFIISAFIGYGIWVNKHKTVKVPRVKGLMVLEGLKKLQELIAD